MVALARRIPRVSLDNRRSIKLVRAMNREVQLVSRP